MTEKTISSSANGCLILILPIALLVSFLFSTWPYLLALVVGGASWNVWQQYQWQKWSQQVNPIFSHLIQENQGRITPLDLAMTANFSATTAKRYLDAKAAEFGARTIEYEDGSKGYYFITAKTLGSIFDESEPPAILPQAITKEVTADLSEYTQQQQQQQQSYQEDVESYIEQKLKLEPTPAEISAPALTPAESSPEPTPAEISVAEETTSKQAEQPPEFLLQSELAKRLEVNSSTVYKHRSDPDFAEWSRSRDPQGIAWRYAPEAKRFFPLEQ